MGADRESAVEFDFTFEDDLAEGYELEETACDEEAADLHLAGMTASESVGADGEGGGDARFAEGACPEERIGALLDSMAPQRVELLGIMQACVEPKQVRDVEELVCALQKNDASVFDAAALCRQLEEAGALERTGDVRVLEPEVVEEDGVALIRPAKREDAGWLTTEAGMAVLARVEVSYALEEILRDEPQYEGVYLRMIEMCAGEAGATTRELGKAFENDPALQQPRMYASYFSKNLEDAQAIRWDGSAWRATQKAVAFADARAGMRGSEL